jgi:hypothetical protein
MTVEQKISIKNKLYKTMAILNAGFLLNERSVHLIKTANTLIWYLK